MSKVTYLRDKIKQLDSERERTIKKINRAYGIKRTGMQTEIMKELVGFAFSDDMNRNWYYVQSLFMVEGKKPRFVVKCIDMRHHTMFTKKVHMNFILDNAENEVNPNTFIKYWRQDTKKIKKERKEMRDYVKNL